MHRRHAILMVLPILVNCSSATTEDSKATALRNACQKVAEDLSSCAAARKAWVSKSGSLRPSCMSEPVPAEDRKELDRAIEQAGRQNSENARLLQDSIGLATTFLKFNLGTQEELERLTEVIPNICWDLDR